jgi:translation initiation factor IF-3
VRLVGDNIPQPQVMSIRDALRLADEMELDLIEIRPYAASPIIRSSSTSRKRRPRN